MNTIQVRTPLTKDEVRLLRAGDILELSGTVYTARDAAHARIACAYHTGTTQPLDWTNQVVFYAGPCPAKPGHVIGPIAATTSARMDGFVETMFRLGLLGMIGKGERAPFVADLCKHYGGIYLLSTGGASALISRQIRACTVVAYEDLATESIKRITVENLRLIVGIDSEGGVFQSAQIARYRRLER